MWSVSEIIYSFNDWHDQQFKRQGTQELRKQGKYQAISTEYETMKNLLLPSPQKSWDRSNALVYQHHGLL